MRVSVAGPPAAAAKGILHQQETPLKVVSPKAGSSRQEVRALGRK